MPVSFLRALKLGQSVEEQERTYLPLDQRTVWAEGGRVFGLKVGDRVLTTQGPGVIVYLEQHYKLPAIRVRLRNKIRWMGKTKIKGIVSDGDRELRGERGSHPRACKGCLVNQHRKGSLYCRPCDSERRGAFIKTILKRDAVTSPRDQRRQERLRDLSLRPQLGQEEVYTTGGKCFHESWCTAVNGVWLSGANTICVVPRGNVMGLRPCRLCETT